MRGLLLLLLMSFAVYTSAQTYTLPVWPVSVPGAKTSAGYTEETIYDQGKPRVSRVTQPQLLVYLPPKEKATGAAVVICPGGGYGRLAIDHEGYDIARWLNDLGIAGIVLKYRLPSDLIMSDKTIGPLQDVQEAIRVVRRNARDWNIRPNLVGVMGFSAGGHLAATASTLYQEQVYPVTDGVSARPDFSILIYGVISMQADITHNGSRNNLLGQQPTSELVNKFSSELQVNAQTPPAFLVHSADDGAVPVENSIRYFQALLKHRVPAELHVYESGGHGYGMGRTENTESTWPETCKRWLKKIGAR